MDSVFYLTAALGLVALCWLSVKSVRMIRRIGFLRFAKGLGAFIASVAGAIIGLVARRRPGTSTAVEDKVALAAEEDYHDKAWDKVGAVSAPEQYLHHSDPEVSGLAQAHLDDD